jgi:hypothetical protein
MNLLTIQILGTLVCGKMFYHFFGIIAVPCTIIQFGCLWYMYKDLKKDNEVKE